MDWAVRNRPFCLLWVQIQEKKTENTGVELDDVWELQKKFDEFQRVSEETLLLHHF